MKNKILISLLFLLLLPISCSNGNSSSDTLMTISRDFNAESVSQINVNISTSRYQSFIFYEKEVIETVYNEFKSEEVDKEPLIEYKSEAKYCRFIYNISFTLNDKQDYKLKYFIYYGDDGTVLYPDGKAYSFNAKDKDEVLYEKLINYSKLQVKNKSLSIQFVDGDNQLLVTTEQNDNYLETSLCNPIWMNIYIPDQDWVVNSDNKNLITISHSNKIDSYYCKYNNPNMYISYQICPMELFENEELKITYKNTTYTINIKSIDYDFSSTSVPTIEELNTTYSQFKKMLDSIDYHRFQYPYIGKDVNGRYGNDFDQTEFRYSVNFEDGYNLNYLPYLVDSCYYPKDMDLPNRNNRANQVTFKMTYTNSNQTEEGADKSTFADLFIGYSLDPNTNDSSLLGYVKYHVIAKDLITSNINLNINIEKYLHHPYYSLANKYDEQYLTYNVNELNIKIIKIDDTLEAFFEDDTYSYQLSCGINSDIIVEAD